MAMLQMWGDTVIKGVMMLVIVIGLSFGALVLALMLLVK